MAGEEIKQLEQQIDKNHNQILEEKEILDFIKNEENLKALGKHLEEKNSQKPEKIGDFSNILKNICEWILRIEGKTLNQIRILLFFKQQFGKNFPELDVKITSFMQQKELEKSIDQEVTQSLQDRIQNLKDLWVNTKTVPNWNLLFTKIKKPSDLAQISTENLHDFLPLNSDLPSENLPYILANFQSLITEHLTFNPEYESFIGLKGKATGLNLETMRDSNKYRQNILETIERIMKKKNLAERVSLALRSADIFELWLKKELWPIKWNEAKQKKIGQIFESLSDKQTIQLLNLMQEEEKNDPKSFLSSFKDPLFHTYMIKKEAYSKTIEGELILNTKGINFLLPLVEKYGSISFKSLLENSISIHTFYKEVKKLWFSTKIPRKDIINFYQEFQKKTEKLAKIKTKAHKEAANTISTFWGREMKMVALWEARWTIGQAESEIFTSIAEHYTKLLLKDSINYWKKITAPKAFWGFTLDFTKGKNPKTIVRDSFWENLSDQWDIFIDNIKNNQQAAFGSLCGMVGGCVLAGAATFSWNIWASSAAFTVGIRLGNWVWQEIWNTWEKVFWASSKGSNQVDKFWDSFLRWIGTHEFKRDEEGNFIKGEDGKIQQEFILVGKNYEWILLLTIFQMLLLFEFQND